MFEDLSPSAKSCGLYDMLADELALTLLRHRARIETTEKIYKEGVTGQFEDDLVERLINSVAAILRKDNPLFNEARFRQRIIKIVKA